MVVAARPTIWQSLVKFVRLVSEKMRVETLKKNWNLVDYRKTNEDNLVKNCVLVEVKDAQNV